MIFENLSPIFVILFSFLVDKEKPTFFEIIAFLLSFLGMNNNRFRKRTFFRSEREFLFGNILGNFDRDEFWILCLPFIKTCLTS